jgi:2-aminoethylphosphonate-pyruvate transaminase
MAQHYGIPCTTTHHPWADPIDVEGVARVLGADPDITHLGTVHHETTTGRLNALGAVAALCREHGVQMLVDGVSSFGAEQIRFEDWPVAACAATANKCLHGVPGTSFVIVNREQLASATPRSVYLDLTAYCSAQDAGGTPFTQSVQTFYALDAALDELETVGGVEARRALYRERMHEIREHLGELGVRPLLEVDDCSCVLHAYHLPAGTTYAELHDGLKERGFVVYAGQGEFATDMFRVSMMGEITPADIARLKAAFREILGD